MKTETLLERTYQLIDSTNQTYQQVADATGLDKNWLMKFKQRAIKEPGVSKVQKVHDFLLAYNAIKTSSRDAVAVTTV